MTRVKVTDEQLSAIRSLLLGGHTRGQVALAYGRSRSWVGEVARRAGLIHVCGGTGAGMWITKEDRAMTNEPWNIDQATYEALITPERERKAVNGASDASTVADEYAPEQSAARGSIEDDVKEAIELLAQAEKQRIADVATIERLNVKANQSRDEVIQLESALRQSEYRARQLESEVKRLHDEIKKEISRGILRERMDGVRQALK